MGLETAYSVRAHTSIATDVRSPKKRAPDEWLSGAQRVCESVPCWLANLPLHLDGQLQFPLGIDLGGANVRMAENGVCRLNTQRLLNFAGT